MNFVGNQFFPFLFRHSKYENWTNLAPRIAFLMNKVFNVEKELNWEEKLKKYSVSKNWKSFTSFFLCRVRLIKIAKICLLVDLCHWSPLQKIIIFFNVFHSFFRSKHLFIVRTNLWGFWTKFLLFMRSGLKNWGDNVRKILSFFNENARVVSGVSQIKVSGLEILSSCLHDKCVVWNQHSLIFWYYEILSLII